MSKYKTKEELSGKFNQNKEHIDRVDDTNITDLPDTGLDNYREMDRVPDTDLDRDRMMDRRPDRDLEGHKKLDDAPETNIEEDKIKDVNYDADLDEHITRYSDSDTKANAEANLKVTDDIVEFRDEKLDEAENDKK